MDNALLSFRAEQDQAKPLDQEEKLAVPSKFLKIFNNHLVFYQSYINKGTVSMSVCLSVGNLFPNTITTSVLSSLCIQVPGEKITMELKVLYKEWNFV